MKCSVEDKLKAVLDIRGVVELVERDGNSEDCGGGRDGGGDEDEELNFKSHVLIISPFFTDMVNRVTSNIFK